MATENTLRTPQEIRELENERDLLRQKILSQQTQIDELTAELRETNQGVVALYAELDDRAGQLKDASDLKSRFLSYMSHEFRTPLGSIMSIARILLDRMDGPLNEEQEKQVRFIQNSATELTEMVNDLLDLAKVEAGKVTISPAWFEMVDLFSALRGMFKPIMDKSEISLIFVEPANIPRLFTDHVKLSHILRNFISNAVKFTQRGEIRVGVRQNDETTMMFTVADTGIGIAAENLESIFHDWVQIASSAQKRLRGSGLGLSLSKRLTELLGGEIRVESKLGVGSTFSVIIPIQLPGHEAMSEEAAAVPGEKARLL
ncbi:sensor histidine kinase [Zavarzinella formosa]|uniref:sensor histidine kinase n=1 Tax=Zavarzinella formosa TaxID=360055 RepID=UPI0003027B74|nr:ATP-binding protein [Zavarzinella formosa]